MWKQDENGRVHTPLEPVVLAATLALIPVLIVEADATSHRWQSRCSPTYATYDLRSTFASNALAAGVTVFELAKIMGTSVRMIEKHYGALLDGAQAGIVARLEALDAASL